ncbi:MAG: elongation factor G [Nitrospirota bacterium]|nr:elongation factor G [Nitrospirota bacterium]
MANFEVENIRNVALIAHSGAGKTSLAEAMLFSSGMTDRLGNVQDGTTVTDFEPEEIDRKITITSSLAFCDWNKYRINIIDTPGFINFIEDTKGCLRVVDGAVILVSAISGVKAETERVWKYACEYEIPRIVFINKMDKDTANFERALDEVQKSFETEPIPLQIPIGAGDSFSGIIDLVTMKAFTLSNNKMTEQDIPADLRDEADKYRKKLVEKIAESDDALLEKYLEGIEPTQDEILSGIKEGSLSRKYIPVSCGAATKNIGTSNLLDTIALCLPSPVEMATIAPISGKNPKNGSLLFRKPSETEPMSAFIFKTIADPYAGKLSLFRVYSGTLKADSAVYNATADTKERIGQVFYLQGKKHVPVQTLGAGEIAVVAKLKETGTGDTLCDEAKPIIFEKVKFANPIISYAIAPKSKGDEEKVSVALHKVLEEDPTLRFSRDEESKEMLISGMGQVHIQVMLDRLKRRFGVEIDMKTPKIPYRETIHGSVKVQGKYKKQSGGKGQYGDCHITVEPLPRGAGFEFVDKVVGGSIPRQYIPAVEKGIIDAMHDGVIAGYQTVDLRVTLTDGSYHTVDSSEMAFKIAGSMALKKAVQEAKPVLLEPMMKIEITIPEESLGAIIGDLNSKRGKVQGVEPQAGANQKINALVPMAEMLTYANQLHGLTSGRGLYSMEFSHYDEVPSHLAQKIVAERQASKQEKHV